MESTYDIKKALDELYSSETYPNFHSAYLVYIVISMISNNRIFVLYPTDLF